MVGRIDPPTWSGSDQNVGELEITHLRLLQTLTLQGAFSVFNKKLRETGGRTKEDHGSDSGRVDHGVTHK